MTKVPRTCLGLACRDPREDDGPVPQGEQHADAAHGASWTIVLMLLIRHGHAGTKERWAGDDRLRPLDSRGRRQAEHLAVVAVEYEPTRLLSSPYLRCLQTMEPIAAKTGLAVEEADALTPSAGERAVTLVRELSGAGPESRFVLCTHGEVIGEALAMLASEDGVRLRRHPPGPKGCGWLLDFRQGKMATAQYISPRR